MQTAFWLAVLGIGAYFLFFRKRRDEGKPAILDAVVAEPTPAREQTSEEAEIARAREKADAGSKAREEAHRKHKAGLQDAEAKLSQADKFVRESELDIAVPWLFEEMHHWPSWLSGPHDWKLPVDISEVEGGGSFGDQWVCWKWNDRNFKLHFLKKKEYGHVEDSEYGDFDVEADDKPVLQINCSRDLQQEFASWRYFSTDALTVGPWIGDLIEFYHVAWLSNEKASYDREAEYTLGRASGIDLNDTDRS